MRRTAVLLALCVLTLLLPGMGQTGAQEKKEGQSPNPGPPQLALKTGDEMPDFTLPDDQGGRVTLSSFRGKKNVAVAFYIFAFSPG